MGSDLHRWPANDAAGHAAAFIASSARLAELRECSALLRRTRMRAEEIVDEARALLAWAEQRGDADHILRLQAQLDQARQAYSKVLTAYVTLCARITEERQSILRAQLERDRRMGLSGAA